MLENPKVSVVIPVYNGEKTLTHCLKSLLNQTYPNYELIVVDNNSTDKTKEIIESFMIESRKIKYAFEPFISRGAARNKGISEAYGEIIAMTDSDCIVPEDWIERMIEPLVENCENVVQGNETFAIKNYWTTSAQEASRNYFRDLFDGKYVNALDTKNFAIKKSALLKAGGFNRSMGNLEDFELKIRLNKNGFKIYFLADLKVKHFHKDRFSSLFFRRIDQGYWASVVFYMHKDYFIKNKDSMVAINNFSGFVSFIPAILDFLLKNGKSSFLFLLTHSIAWRIGVMKHMLQKENF